ncbi:hypothetical protein P8452_74580 [Trifolium repens]|nr:hypothetical protein P8452_74580 [Trifolium repens]
MRVNIITYTNYGQALDVHKNRVTPERLEKWINALTSVADFRGCHIERAKGIYEFQYIYDIIQEILAKLAGYSCLRSMTSGQIYPALSDGSMFWDPMKSYINHHSSDGS